ncbi:MAG TPA: ABC transporter permease [Bryobacteraceae bacterium]|jgi:predicted permease
MPDWRKLVRARLAQLNMTAGAESDLADELAQHLEDSYGELCSSGVPAEEAYRRTIAELDDVHPLRASLVEADRLPRRDPVQPGAAAASNANFVEGVWADLRYAVRNNRRNPLFVLAVVLTLALGIGANTTVFTLINTLILNPLPVRNASELVAVAPADTRATAAESAAPLPFSYADLKDYQSRNQVFQSLAGFSTARGITWIEHGNTQGMFGELVTGNYFSTLGLTPVRGRFFSNDEDGPAGANPIAVINYGSWQQRFGGDPNIVGRQLQVNNVVLTIIGVAPPHFIGMSAIFGPDLWVPASMSERLYPNSMQHALTDRGKAGFLAVGRLMPGVTASQASANVASIADGLARSYPDTNEGRSAVTRPLRDVLLSTGGNAASSIVFASAALAAVVGIVLLIACSNVANLLLARSAARQQEMAVRLAMGASRSRLIRQLITESMLLGVLSGAVGLLMARWGLQILFGRLPGAANFPTPHLDASVFLFALAVSLATGLLFGAIPAWKASRSNVAETLKEAGRTAGRVRSRVTVANALLVGQVAFSFLLLVTAALFLRSIGRAYRIDPGFQTAHLATFPTNPGQAGYGKPQSKAFYKNVRDRVVAMPGVESVSWSSNMPLWARSVTGIEVEGLQKRSRSEQVRAVIDTVDRGYFETAGVGILDGRSFTEIDQEHSVPVAIVNEKMARDYWPAGALGKRIQLPGDPVPRVVVGVARLANYTGWGEAPQACVYVPLTQNYSDTMVLYVRSKGSPGELLAPVEREIRAAGPQVLLFGIRTGSEIIDGGLFQARMGVGLLTVFGLLALGLASIGLYGVLAYSVNQRRREIGVRIALGATRINVLRLVLGEGMTLVMTGVLIGFVAALAIGNLLSRMLFGLGATDPVSIAAAVAVLSVVALLACYLPARGATRVDPLVALREG